MELFVHLGQIVDETLILPSHETYASFSRARNFNPHHPWMRRSNARYDAYGIVMRSTNRRVDSTPTVINDASYDSTVSLEQERQILQRWHHIPPPSHSEHMGGERTASLHQDSLWRAETPNASSGSNLSEEFISDKLKTDAAWSRLEEETCVICLDAIQVNHEEMSTTLCCGHVYHMRCIKTWLMVKNECALCRASVIPINER